MSAQIASVRHPTRGVPVAAAVQRARVASKPVIANPPAVRVVGIRTVAMPVVVAFVSVSRIAVSKVAIIEVWILPSRLVDDAAEPALAVAVDRPVEVGGFYTLGRARGP